MKILYVSSDRRAAELAAFALGTDHPDLTVAWAATLAGAHAWVHEQSGSALLIVEVEADEPALAALVTQLRHSGATTPLIAVSLTNPAPPLPSLNALGAQVVVKDGVFLAELPAIVNRALRPAPPKGRRVRIGYAGDSALARECFAKSGRLIEVIDAPRVADGKFDPFALASQPGRLPFDVLLIEHGYPGVDVYGILKNIAERKVQVPVVLVAEWVEDLALLASKFGVIDYVVKSRASFRALVFRLNRLLAPSSRRPVDGQAGEATSGLQARLSAAEAALEAGRTRHGAELHAERAKRETVEQQLKDAHTALETTKHQHALELREATARVSDGQKRTDIRLAQAAEDVARVRARFDAELAQATSRAGVLETELADANSRLISTAASIEALESKLSETTARVEQAEVQIAADRQEHVSALAAAAQHHEREMSEAAARLADHQKFSDLRVAQAAATVQLNQTKMREAVAETQRAEQRAAADRHTAAEEQAQLRTRFETDLAQEISQKRVLETEVADTRARLTAAIASIETLKSKVVDAQTELDQQARNKHALETELADAAARLNVAAASIQVLESKVVETHTALEQARRQHDLDLTEAVAETQRVEQRAQADRQTATEEAARVRARFDADLAQEVASKQVLTTELADTKGRLVAAIGSIQELKSKLSDTTTRLERADVQLAADRQQHLSAMAAATTRAEESRQRSEAKIAQLTANARTALENAATQHARELTEAAARLEDHQKVSEQRAATDRQAALEDLAQLRVEFDAELAQALSAKQGVERELAETIARLTTAEAAAQALESKLSDTMGRLERAELQIISDHQDHLSVMTAAAARTDELRQQSDATIAQLKANAESALETAAREHAREMGDAAARLAEHQTLNEERAAASRQAAAERVAQLRATFDAELAQELSAKQTLDTELANAHARLTAAAASIEALESNVADTTAKLERAHVQITTDHQEHVSAMAGAAARADESRQQFETKMAQLRAEAQSALETAARRHAAEMSDAAARLAEHQTLAESRLAQVAADAVQRQATFDAELARERQEHAAATDASAVAERARLDALIAKHSAELDQLSRRQQARDDEASRTLANVEGRLNAALAEQQDDRRVITQLQTQLVALDEELQTTKTRRDVLKAEADWVPQLRKQIADLQAEHHRQFERSPIAMCVCTGNGAVTEVNQALASLLDYDSAEELLEVDLAATVCASADELAWIVSGSQAAPSADPIETTWTRKDGTHIVVRIRRLPRTSGEVVLAVEDITVYRETQERLNHAQRMEAVARHASEVAVTCDKLLAAVKEEAERWLAASDSDIMRRHGPSLLEEVARATGFVRQLSASGSEQLTAPEIVNLPKVVRDLQPVLKRIVGGDVKIVAPKRSNELNVDVEADRVARILVNIAIYGRGRMTADGRLLMEVAPVVLDRTFVTKYPNVRSGAHVLLTITEERAEARSVLALVAPDGRIVPAPEKSSIDLSALQALISDCGGHLWVMAEPSGSMTLKIHLPRRPLDGSISTLPAKRSTKGRWLRRLSGVGL